MNELIKLMDALAPGRGAETARLLGGEVFAMKTELPKLKPCPMCGFSNTEVIEGTIDLQGYCPACQMQGPDRSTEIYAIKSWNSIPRRSEVMELLRLVDELKHASSRTEVALALRYVIDCADKLRKEIGE